MFVNFINRVSEYGRDSKSKGNEFEIYCAEKFKDCNFEIVDWRRDNYNKERGIKVLSSSWPDLLIRERVTKKRFAVECKYRKHLKGKSSVIARDYNIKNYKNFEKNKHIKTYILLGVGGFSNNPECIYLIPVSQLPYAGLIGPSIIVNFTISIFLGAISIILGVTISNVLAILIAFTSIPIIFFLIQSGSKGSVNLESEIDVNNKDDAQIA